MSTKELMLEIVREMPNDVTAEIALEELAFRLHVEEGLRDADNGNVISHEQFKTRMAKWLE